MCFARWRDGASQPSAPVTTIQLTTVRRGSGGSQWGGAAVGVPIEGVEPGALASLCI